MTIPWQIGLLLIDGFSLMSYSSFTEPLRAANLLKGDDIYQVTNISVRSEMASSSSGALIPCVPLSEHAPDFGHVFVVAGGNPERFSDRRAFNWLSRLDRRGIAIGGISGGPVILAKAGIMKGVRMTVHWEHAEYLEETQPDLILERSIFVIDGDRVTCAGGTAPLDLVHVLIAEMHGQEFARSVSDWFMHTDVRTSESAQRSSLVERYGLKSKPVMESLSAMESHLSDPLALGQLAMLSNISTRQLNRLFKDEFSQTTMSFYRRLRLEAAHRLISNTLLPVGDVALAAGFSDASHFSRQFKECFGHSPTLQRARSLDSEA